MADDLPFSFIHLLIKLIHQYKQLWNNTTNSVTEKQLIISYRVDHIDGTPRKHPYPGNQL